ncbi:hypothetical protein ABIF55_000581 [Bradyrhizobium diazoefficiens]
MLEIAARWRTQTRLETLSSTSAPITAPIRSSGRGMPSQKCTPPMVTIWPTTAVQRSWISNAMFLRLVSSSVGAAPISSLRASACDCSVTASSPNAWGGVLPSSGLFDDRSSI